MQRDALLNLHRKQVEADEEKKKDTINRQKGFAWAETKHYSNCTT